MTLWILVANSSFAEIYAADGKSIERIHLFDFPEGRQKSGEVYSDKPGRSFDRPRGSVSRGAGGQSNSRHAYSSQNDFHAHEQDVFAHRIISVLDKAKATNNFDQLDIIAPPQFLGDLRKVMHDSLKKLIRKEINKEIPSHISERERVDLIRRYLELPKPASSAI